MPIGRQPVPDPSKTPLPAVARPPRRTIVSLNPNLTDSPLRRALYDAHNRPPASPATANPE